jgi:glucokinase
MARYLGAGIANIVTILGPDRVVLGGGVAQAGPPFFRLVRAAVVERARMVPSAGIEIVPAELGVDAGAIGAALTADPARGG